VLRVTALCVLFAAIPLAAGPDWRGLRGREAERVILRAWDSADAAERCAMLSRLRAIEHARRFVDARPVLVPFEGRTWTLDGLFGEVLEPALDTPTTVPADRGDVQPVLDELRVRALNALQALRDAYAPPAPVSTGTLNLLLGYAADALSAPALASGPRLRIFGASVDALRVLDGRVVPDLRSAWLVRTRLLPALTALARDAERDRALEQAVSEAAAQFFMPSILDPAAQARLAPLTRGVHSRRLLERAYRDGALDEMGVAALARSTALEASGDPTWLAGAAPLLLELLCDPMVTPHERAQLAEVVRTKMAASPPLRDTARELLAAALDVAPAPLEELSARCAAAGDRLPRPDATGQRVRFLRVVMVQEERELPPGIVGVVRLDATRSQPLRVTTASGGAGRFVGVLVPSDQPGEIDFLGPPPTLGERIDNRLLRRPLRGERISVMEFGTRSEGMELCAALPEDASEPVPVEGAGLANVVDLIDRRLAIASDPGERADLIALLVRVGTLEARRTAIARARTPAGTAALLPLVERGDEDAAVALLRAVDGQPLETRERLYEAALLHGSERIHARMEELVRGADVGSACLAADALLSHGDPSGVEALMEHPSREARACAAALALRLSPLAGNLRVTVDDPAALDRVRRRAATLFPAGEGKWWARFGTWLARVLADDAALMEARRDHKPLYLGQRQVAAFEFAVACTEAVKAGEARELWGSLVYLLLSPVDPGAGIAEGDLAKLLDALQARVGDGVPETLWDESLLILVCAQHALKEDTWVLSLAQDRLARRAGLPLPPGVLRKPGVYWPIWFAERAAGAPDGD